MPPAKRRRRTAAVARADALAAADRNEELEARAELLEADVALKLVYVEVVVTGRVVSVEDFWAARCREVAACRAARAGRREGLEGWWRRKVGELRDQLTADRSGTNRGAAKVRPQRRTEHAGGQMSGAADLWAGAREKRVRGTDEGQWSRGVGMRDGGGGGG